MHTFRLSDLRPTTFACRTAALALFACAATVVRAEQPAVGMGIDSAPVFSATASTPLTVPTSFASATSDLGYSSSTGAAETEAAETFITSADSALQPPPRRRYGRPRYSDSSHNPDGSNKWTGEGGVGFTVPISNTHKYYTPSYDFGVGVGRNFNKNFAVLLQFDWDNFGLQGSTIANYTNNYNASIAAACTAVYPTSISSCESSNDIGGLDGHAHVWSFTLNPTYTFTTTGAYGAYVTAGVGFYHKVTTFTLQETGEEEDAYGNIYEYAANANFDHYTANAPGFNAGIGLTYKPSKFANERFFAEADYVFVDTQQRYGLTAANAATYPGLNYYPQNSNHTAYVPVKFGLRF